MKFTREQLDRYRNAMVDDLIDGRPKLVFVGINPGLWTAATNTHFAHPSNRFYPALHLAGITSAVFDHVGGLTANERVELTAKGIAITNIVPYATARASELTRAQLQQGAIDLTARLQRWRPIVVAVAGVTAFRTAFRRPRAALGRQAQLLAGATLWVVPNPSGLNAHETVASLAEWYRRVAREAGVQVQ
ncbi:MAG: mismatch-specific DNA-glycosylase [Nitriliruptoraceae bacterium]